MYPLSGSGKGDGIAVNNKTGLPGIGFLKLFKHIGKLIPDMLDTRYYKNDELN
jgi:hypothetical protein